jgi:hypothetical protein
VRLIPEAEEQAAQVIADNREQVEVEVLQVTTVVVVMVVEVVTEEPADRAVQAAGARMVPTD